MLLLDYWTYLLVLEMELYSHRYLPFMEVQVQEPYPFMVIPKDSNLEPLDQELDWIRLLLRFHQVRVQGHFPFMLTILKFYHHQIQYLKLYHQNRLDLSLHSHELLIF